MKFIKEAEKFIYTYEFDKSVVTYKRVSKASGATYVAHDPLKKFAKNQEGFANQLLLKGFKEVTQ